MIEPVDERGILSPRSLQTMRERMGLSQSQLAALLGGVHKQTIKSWEAPPDKKWARQIPAWAAIRVTELHDEAVA